ncbi:MAG: hypothetical protein [Microviridae sp.]|nr:MAG: hypothetical protein [Microviridae sp.]
MKKVKNLRVRDRILTTTSIQEVTEIRTVGKYVVFRTKRIFPTLAEGEYYCTHRKIPEAEVTIVNHRNANKIRENFLRHYEISA